MAARFLESIGKLGVAISAVAGVAQASLYNVEAGHRAVIFDRFEGVKTEVIGEGTHFRIPWLQRPIIFDVRTKPRNIPTVTGSKDLQNVSITLRILYRPRISQLARIYTQLGEDFDERVLPSIGMEVLKSVVAQFDAGELITQRDLVSKRCRDALIGRANEFDIALDDVSITHLTFGREFTQAVEQKQVAQQEAERARFVVEKAEQEKLANIIRAEGDAKAAEMISEALKEAGEGLIELRKIDTAKEIAGTLAKSRNVVYLPGGNNMLMNVPTA
eukprot:Colp12_sorted_trinity150504_noHs@1749